MHTTFFNFGSKYANQFQNRSCFTTFNKLHLFEHVSYPTGDPLKSEWNRVEQRRKKRLDTGLFWAPSDSLSIRLAIAGGTQKLVFEHNQRTTGHTKISHICSISLLYVCMYVPKHVTSYVCIVRASVMQPIVVIAVAARLQTGPQVSQSV